MAARAGAPRARALLRAASSPAWWRTRAAAVHYFPLVWDSEPRSPKSHGPPLGLRVGVAANRARGWRLEPGRGSISWLEEGGGLLLRLATSWRLKSQTYSDRLLPTEESGLSVDNGRRIPSGCGGPRSSRPVGVLAPS